MVSTVSSAVTGYVKNIFLACSSAYEGMAVTMSWMFRRPMTVQYPDKIPRPVQEELPEAYRGLLEIDTGVCIGCALCAKTCPIGCIAIATAKREDGERLLTRADINWAKCMHCGLCTEVCTTQALRHTREFEGANAYLENLVVHYVQGEPKPVYKVKKDEVPPTLPVGAALKKAIRPAFRRPGKGV